MLSDRVAPIETLRAAEQKAGRGDRDGRRRIARALTEVLAPAPVAAALLAVIAWQSAPTAQEAILWGSIAVVFASLIPIAYILRGVRGQRFSDHHVGVRQQRPMPLLVGIVSVVVGVAVLNLFGAPRTLVALIEAMLVGLVVSLAVTLFWKISIHVAVVAGSVVVLVLVFGPIALIAAPLVAAVAWARVQLRDHTPLQVVLGAAVGMLVAGGTFPLLR
jgi:membrane-associated phospholipid phosphatase